MSATRSRVWRRRLIHLTRIACAVSCALAGLGTGASWGAVYKASPGTGDGTAGTCVEAGKEVFNCADLRAALTRANADPGSTVRLAAGPYQLGEAHGYPAGQLAFLAIGTSVKIEGAGPQSTTIEQTDGRDPVIVVSHNGSGQPWTIAIEGVKLTGGVAAGHQDGEVFGDEEGGGGLRINGGGTSSSLVVTLRDDAFVGNEAHAKTAHGGAIFNGDATLNVIGTTIAKNTARANGRSSNTESGDAQGGGIFNLGHLLIANSTINDNTVQAGGEESQAVGGGVDSGVYTFTSNNSLAIANTTITGNLATAGSTHNPPFVAGGGVAMDGGFLDHVTLYGNTASPTNAWEAWAGNLYDTDSAGAWIKNTIIGDGSAGEGPNCLFQAFLPYPENETDDFEDDGGLHPECGFSVDYGSIVGIPAELQPLAAAGGPTETLAPTPGSPTIGASDQCEGPFGESGTGWETAIVPLDVDQRGQPRRYPCDIGAFQTERPSVAAPPSIVGTAEVGGSLTCGAGSWTGEGTLTYGFEWLRNGVSSGDRTTSYEIAPRDAGARLACLVTATGTYGSTEATSAALLVPVSREGPPEESQAGEAPPGESPTIVPPSEPGPVQFGGPPPGESSNGGPSPRTEALGTSSVGTARIASLLAGHLLPSGRAMRISELLRRGGSTLTLPAELRGRLVVGWYLGSKRGLLVAKGHGLVGGGIRKVAVKLTAAGRRLLTHQGRFALVAYATLLPRTGGPAVEASKSLLLVR